MTLHIVSATDHDAVLDVAERLRRGAVVVAPTDTNYGVFCNPFHRGAAERMYAMKGRDGGKPLSLFVASPVDWNRWAVPPPHPGFQPLLDDVWPAPRTTTRCSADCRHPGGGWGSSAVVVG